MWKCGKCAKPFNKIHSARCHYPKCKNVRPEVKEFRCTVCTDSFDTALGLSVHERHRHSDLRNKKRGELAQRPYQKNGRALSVWTEKETSRLGELNERFKNDKYSNVKIRELLPIKTLKQISVKRQTLGRIDENAPQPAPQDSPSETDAELDVGQNLEVNAQAQVEEEIEQVILEVNKRKWKEIK